MTCYRSTRLVLIFATVLIAQFAKAGDVVPFRIRPRPPVETAECSAVLSEQPSLPTDAFYETARKLGFNSNLARTTDIRLRKLRNPSLADKLTRVIQENLELSAVKWFPLPAKKVRAYIMRDLFTLNKSVDLNRIFTQNEKRHAEASVLRIFNSQKYLNIALAATSADSNPEKANQIVNLVERRQIALQPVRESDMPIKLRSLKYNLTIAQAEAIPVSNSLLNLLSAVNHFQKSPKEESEYDSALDAALAITFFWNNLDAVIDHSSPAMKSAIRTAAGNLLSRISHVVEKQPWAHERVYRSVSVMIDSEFNSFLQIQLHELYRNKWPADYPEFAGQHILQSLQQARLNLDEIPAQAQ